MKYVDEGVGEVMCLMQTVSPRAPGVGDTILYSIIFMNWMFP